MENILEKIGARVENHDDGNFLSSCKAATA